MPSSRTHLALLALLPAVLAAPAAADNWPQWRGPAGDSVSQAKGLPLTWGEKTNVAWKTPLPGDGASSPAVWGGAVFVTCQKDDRLLLLRLRRDSGQVEWTRTVGTGTAARVPPRGKTGDARRAQKFHPLHNLASPSPVTDGRRVFAHFGNGDLAAYDFDGRQLWHHNLQKEHGPYTIWWGRANSPVLYKDLVITVCLQDSLSDLPGGHADSYLLAHDQATGVLRWKTLRRTAAQAEECDAYTTPVFHEAGGRVEMIVMGGNQLDAYDPATGRQLWYLPGLVGGRTITGPTVGLDMVFATRGMRGEMVAVKLGGSGKLSDGRVAWTRKQGTPDSPCPVLWKGLLFWVTDNGFAHCADARTGALKWTERLPGDYKASPLAGEGRIYFLNLAGRCTVVEAADRFTKLAENQLDDEFLASPAAVDGRLLLRGRKAFYALGKP
jgi:outer membrane protein assembly factor BamB